MICAGVNATLACDYGSQPAVITILATATIDVKAASSYRVTVVNGTGPAGISTIVTARFASTGSATAAITAGGTDTVDLTLKIKGGTATGTYTGTVVLTDSLTGITASFPISMTH